MITPKNINNARRLVASFPDAWDKRNNGQAGPLMAWLSEAKPLVSYSTRQRPNPLNVAVALGKLVKRYDAAAAHVATANPLAHVPDIGGDPMPSAPADVLPPPPAVITVHIRPGRSVEIADATTVADYNAARSPIAVTARTLAQYEAELREKAKRHAAFVGVDDEARRMLNIAAHLHEAAKLLDPNATPDQDNA